ncbi:hypothetical protein L873DRAFT_1043870 [Choiromyces venosus 120613-1]|uniref:Uncharacterized protein n=1 Tax=Choiromyces venosus 120613-1 TaxID=1336337 RepID=A0A3N4JJL7_9PEZI|nr:hypothetical protein L873DRAFT_1043870 [Choiromyces venosus 120613-1]
MRRKNKEYVTHSPRPYLPTCKTFPLLTNTKHSFIVYPTILYFILLLLYPVCYSVECLLLNSVSNIQGPNHNVTFFSSNFTMVALVVCQHSPYLSMFPYLTNCTLGILMVDIL